MSASPTIRQETRLLALLFAAARHPVTGVLFAFLI
jgi:hypothetical protein